jgi:hypothetical protein
MQPTTPILGVKALFDITMEGRIRPINNLLNQSMLDRIEVLVIHVSLIFFITSNLMLPEPSLPDRRFPVLALRIIHSFLKMAEGFCSSGKTGFNQAPTD